MQVPDMNEETIKKFAVARNATIKKNGRNVRRDPVRKYLFPEQSSSYFCQKPPKVSASLCFVASIQEFFSSYETAKHFKMRNNRARKGKIHR